MSNRHFFLIALLLPLLGIVVCVVTAIEGQTAARQLYQTENRERAAFSESQLLTAQIKLRGLQDARPSAKPDDVAVLDTQIAAVEKEIPKLQKEADIQKEALDFALHVIWSYKRPGRHYTQWDGWRYEEIIVDGYLYHHPDSTPAEKEATILFDPRTGERRAKNVVWYPLYPVLGWMVMKATGLPAHHALTVVSSICIVLASLLLAVFVRNHVHDRRRKFMPTNNEKNGESNGKSDTSQSNSQIDNTLSYASPSLTHRASAISLDTVAGWTALLTLVLLLFEPSSVFLYANFTESLFVLLLVSFLLCLQKQWWWRAALVAAVASSCRSQGVLFGPILALVYLLRGKPALPIRFGAAFVMGCISAIGLLCYMTYLQITFGDALAFMHAQVGWNVGINAGTIKEALNPANAVLYLWHQLFPEKGPILWPKVWEACCLIWPPIVLLLGRKRLSLELTLVGWMMWGLPYVSNSLAGNPPNDSKWMSMGRFMVVLIPAQIILAGMMAEGGAWLNRSAENAEGAEGTGFRRFCAAVGAVLPWVLLPLSIWGFAIIAYKYGTGQWVG